MSEQITAYRLLMDGYNDGYVSQEVFEAKLKEWREAEETWMRLNEGCRRLDGYKVAITRNPEMLPYVPRAPFIVGWMQDAAMPALNIELVDVFTLSTQHTVRRRRESQEAARVSQRLEGQKNP